MRKTSSSKWEKSRAPKCMHFMCMRKANLIWRPNRKQKGRNISSKERTPISIPLMTPPAPKVERESKE
jgi:hypothetical protein